MAVQSRWVEARVSMLLVNVCDAEMQRCLIKFPREI